MKNTNFTNEELVVLYQEAVGYRKDDLLIELMDRMSGIMHQVVRQFSNIPNCDEWDRLSLIHLEFVKCLDRFDIEQGKKLTTVAKEYFVRCMQKFYVSQTRVKRGKGDEASYDALVEAYENGEGGETISFSTTCIGYDDTEFMDMLDTIGLTDNERMTCTLVLQNGLKRKEIAQVLGVSEVSVHNYLKNIGKKMSNSMVYA